MGKRVAILGAGIQGSCLALELAARGLDVDLLDRNHLPLSEASLWNEGKIHLGFIYANDFSGRTSQRMIEGAADFAPFLVRHLGAAAFKDAVSTPFNYCVLKGGLLSVDQIRAHFSRVSNQIKAMFSGMSRYPETLQPWGVRALPAEELAQHYDPDRVAAVFQTHEISVDPDLLAMRIRQALQAAPRIRFWPGSNIESVSEPRRNEFSVQGSSAGRPKRWKRYSHVVNALWGGRLKVDATIGLRPSVPYVFRHKLAMHVRNATGGREIPSSTFMLGPYGDIVNFGGGRFYFSWYPAGLIGETDQIDPPDFESKLSPDDFSRIQTDSLRHLAELAPQIGDLDLSKAEIAARGGLIFSWGDSAIEEPTSQVHQRWDIGITARGGYLSIDTGKYGMAPRHAQLAANYICGPID